MPDKKSMAEKLFPSRTRCKTCRKNLTDVVLSGLYCSYPCAGKPVPSKNVSAAPRHCKREVNGSWDFKTKFRSVDDVPAKLRQDPGTNIYECDYCLFLHVGHSRPTEFTREKLRRTVSDVITIGSVIKRTREEKNIPIPLLAKKLGVPAIRIKEIEAGEAKMNAQIMLDVLRILGIQTILQEK